MNALSSGSCMNRSLLVVPSGRMRNVNQPNSVTEYRQQHHKSHALVAPTCFDVINGRGKSVHIHPGNQKYRSLVHLNKRIYAMCPRSDKAKISKGIVAAIREFGGGFLELDERSGTYHDIGDKAAWAKTSQALREGQTKIRQKIYREEEGHFNYDSSMPALSTHDTKTQAIPTEGYFGYSVRVLESLYNSEEPAPSQPRDNNDTLAQWLPDKSGSISGLESSQEETNLDLLANICAV